MADIINLTLEQFIEQYQRKVEFACLYELNRYNTALRHIEPEEFFQDAWVVIARNYHRYDPTKSSPSTWIINICKTLGKYYYRRTRCPKRKGFEVPIENLFSPDNEKPWRSADKRVMIEKTKTNGQSDPLKAMLREQDVKLVRECIGDLKKTHQVVLRLHMEGMSVREIAETVSNDTGVPLRPIWAARVKRRALAALKKEIVKARRVPPKQVHIPWEKRSIRFLGLSTQTANALYSYGIITIGELENMTEGALLAIPKFGRRRLLEVKRALQTGAPNET